MTNENRSVPASPNEMVDAWVKSATEAERRWNEFFNQMMGTDAFAQMMARSAESQAAFQATFARGMEQYLRGLNIPTHSDLAKLGERLTTLERRVDALTASDGDDGAADADRPAGRLRSRTSSRAERAPSDTGG